MLLEAKYTLCLDGKRMKSVNAVHHTLLKIYARNPALGTKLCLGDVGAWHPSVADAGKGRCAEPVIGHGAIES